MKKTIQDLLGRSPAPLSPASDTDGCVAPPRNSSAIPSSSRLALGAGSSTRVNRYSHLAGLVVVVVAGALLGAPAWGGPKTAAEAPSAPSSPSRPPPRTTAPAVTGTTPYTPEERKEIEALLGESKTFSKASESYRQTVNGIVKRAHSKRLKTLVAKYEEQIKKEEAEERVRRIAAITLFEDFLRRYPNDPRWTPDVIFRLAELYFEKSHDEYLQAEDSYQKNMAAYDTAQKQFEKGKLTVKPTPPSTPKQDYSKTVYLHQKLIREFPNYRLIEGAYYLVGFCLGEMGKETLGNQAFLALVCTNKHKPPLTLTEPAAPAADSTKRKAPLPGGDDMPMKPTLNVTAYQDCVAKNSKGRFNAEAWIRIGEFHFDENQFGEAIAAYSRVLKLGPKSNTYYDEALYKLAWTYYRADRFMEAIKHFDQLVAYSDKEYERTGKYGSEMRPESIQYLAISFSEEDWDGDTNPDPESGFQRIEKFYGHRTKEKHVYEVYRRLADIYMDIHKYDDAVMVYKLCLKRWPFRSDNPELQDKVIMALERQRKFDKAMAEREEFTRLFGKNTEWEKRNRNNPKALKKAQEYDEQALIQAAVFHHKKGQEAMAKFQGGDQPAYQTAKAEYGLAARAYKKYIERFPNTKNSYDIRYSYAFCLFFSERFAEAGKIFEAVRDSNLDNRYQEEAAHSAIKSYEELIKRASLTTPDLPQASKPPATLKPITMPEYFAKWQASLDAYGKVLPKSPKTPRLTYKAAELSYRFLNFTDARTRFASIYQKHCGDPMAVNAGQAILVTYQLEKNMDKMEEWAIKLKAGKCGKSSGSTDYGTLISGIRFKKANAAMKAQQWDKAAAAFLALVDSDPKAKDAPAALNNAAVSYEKSKRFESALKIYERIWKEYPQSEHSGNALWRTALNYQRTFEFSRAVNNYLILANSPKFASDPNRKKSILRAAVILENDQAYERSAKLFIRYARAMGPVKKGAEAFYKAGLIYEKMGNYGKMVQTFRDFSRTYGSVEGQAASVVEGLFKIGNGAQNRGDWKTARKYYKLTQAEFTMKGLAPASDAAEYAAQAAFMLAEKKMEKFLKTTIKGAVNTLPRKEAKMAKAAKTLMDEYNAIWTYKRARWMLAAMYRSGVIYDHFARSLDGAYRKAPIPKKLQRLGDEAMDMYRDQVDQLMRQRVDPIFAKAKTLYANCVQKARDLGVSNKYTEDALIKLNGIDPDTYPLLKRAKVETSLQ